MQPVSHPLAFSHTVGRAGCGVRVVVAVDGQAHGDERLAALHPAAQVVPDGLRVSDEHAGERHRVVVFVGSHFKLAVVFVDEREFRHLAGNLLHDGNKNLFHNVMSLKCF